MSGSVHRERLPIDEVLPQVLDALRRAPSVVLQAPTGAGKTTRVPPALLDAGLAAGRQVVMLEPRRLAARAAARRMAYERGAKLGGEVGYHVRFDRQAGRDTRLLVVTEGILLRMLHDDPFLESVGAVAFDEFHERSLDNDLALGMMRLLQRTVRPDLKIAVMSATLATAEVSRYLDDCPTVVSQGRLHPVEIAYEPRSTHEPWPEATARAVSRLLDRTPGDLLVFLPGVGEIRQTAKQLESLAAARDLAVVPLYGDLPADQQDEALMRGPRRRIVLSTNVAETSVTVEGITGVVDTGLARILTFDANVGLDRLEIMPIARSSADQRAGRAGRLQPGVCVRLWSPAQHLARDEHPEPEVRRVDLASAALHLLALGEHDLRGFPWFEPPREQAIAQTLQLLELLGATHDGQLTSLGRLIAQLPVHPRIGRLLIEGRRRGCARRAALAAALLSERDPFLRGGGPGGGGPPPRHRHAGALTGGRRRAATTSDLLDRVEAMEEFAETGRSEFPLGALNRHAARFVLQAQEQLLRSLRGAMRDASRDANRDAESADQIGAGPSDWGVHDDAESEEALLRSVLAAMPDRVAIRREPDSPRGLMVGGRGVRLDATSAVTEAEMFVCVDVEAGQAEANVRQASAVEREWLPAEQFSTRVEVEFDEAASRVSARRRVRFLDLLLDESPAPLPNDEVTAEVLARAASERLDRVLPADDSEAGKFMLRWRCLRQWMPELELPELSDDRLLAALKWLAVGCRSLEDLRRADWISALGSLLEPKQRQALDREAPQRLQVPSGSWMQLTYELGRPPVLAVRIQEVFGLRDTPRIAGGRVRVLLHLLGPNYRPQQVTDDLLSFWTNAYPIVRKELKRRYPKHAWPEDPWTASPERKGKSTK